MIQVLRAGSTLKCDLNEVQDAFMKRDNNDEIRLKKLEESLWREATRFDRAYMDALLASDFFEIGMSGKKYQRAEALDVQAQSISAVLPLARLTVDFLHTDVALLTYISTDHFLNSARSSYRTSLWTRENGRWLLRFHQGTPIDP